MRVMDTTSLIIMAFLFLALKPTLQGKRLENTIKPSKTVDQSILEISKTIIKQKNPAEGKKVERAKMMKHYLKRDGVPGHYRQDQGPEGRETQLATSKTRSFFSWHRYLTNKQKILRRHKKVKICTVVLAYTLKDKCEILRIRLK